MLTQGEILTLDDNKTYTVVYSTELDSINYVYLIDRNDIGNNMFCSFDKNNQLQEVVDPKLVEKLLLDFKNNFQG
ncbi:MAG: hypothetical protein IKQ35_03670 [Bacilli bacterium]|nr:hypothetical protein [Bacilli bacterium]